MGKKIIIPGADFSGVAIASSPFEFVVPAGQSITINGTTYGGALESAYGIDTIPQSGLNGDSALYNLKAVIINAPFTALVGRYLGNQRALKEVSINAPVTPTDAVSWFFSCVALEKVEGLSNIDFSLVTSVYAMFYACEALEFIDLAGVDLSNVTTFTSMFVGCSALKNVACDNYNYSALLSQLQTDLTGKTWSVNESHTLIIGE